MAFAPYNPNLRLGTRGQPPAEDWHAQWGGGPYNESGIAGIPGGRFGVEGRPPIQFPTTPQASGPGGAAPAWQPMPAGGSGGYTPLSQVGQGGGGGGWLRAATGAFGGGAVPGVVGGAAQRTAGQMGIPSPGVGTAMPGAPAPAGDGDFVQMRSPTGLMGRVHRSRLQEALAAGGQVVG